MESTRDVRRLTDREIKKGSAPLSFDHIEYPKDALQEITSEPKLGEVLAYLLRTAEFEGLANDMTRNNVYTENHLIRGGSCHRLNHAVERSASYRNIMGYARRCAPEYDRKTFVETVSCFYSFPAEELVKYRFEYNGEGTYAFPLSGRHIINGLYCMAIMHRKSMAWEKEPDFIRLPQHRQIFHLENIRKVLFQCLLLDDMRLKDGLFEAKLHTVYLL